MSAKKRPRGIVYSTDPAFRYDWDEHAEPETPAPAGQNLRVYLERLKGNKKLTVIKGFIGSSGDLAELGRNLKSACGTGGSVKDGDILVQGDHREKIVEILTEQGYGVKKAGG